MADYSDMIGKAYNYWTVVGLSPTPCFVRCKCRCGTERDVSVSLLKSGGSKSCGCIKTKKDGTPYAPRSAVEKVEPGQRYGRLTVLEETDQRLGGRVVWKCLCDCGNVAHVTASRLKNGTTKSCGCLSSEVHREICKDLRKKLELDYIDGTQVTHLMQQPSMANTSGKTGVSWDKSCQLWKATIIFKGHCYYLGGSKDIEYAISIREEAEKRVHGAFLDWYYDTFPEQKRNKRGKVK